MSFNVKSGNAEDIRKKLLKEKGIGIIQIDPNTLRVAFSSIDEEKIEEVYKSIYEVAESM
jgi:ribosomal protein S10